MARNRVPCKNGLLDGVAKVVLFFLFPAHGLAFEFDMDGVVDEPVHDGVGQGGLGDVVVPLVEGQLRDDDHGLPVVALLQDLQQGQP